MKLNIAVVDDRSRDCEMIKTMLYKYFSDKSGTDMTVSEFESVEGFLQSYRKGTFQLLFLDILLNGINGIELSKRLRTGDKDIKIVFMSSSTEYIFETFSVKPEDFLYKPYTYEKLSETMDRLMCDLAAEIRTFHIKLSKAEFDVPISEIMTAVSDKHCTYIDLISGQAYKCTLPYSAVSSELLNEPCFLECNRGIIVNMNYVVKSDAEGRYIKMQDGKLYPMRFRDRRALQQKLTVYTATKLKGGFDI